MEIEWPSPEDAIPIFLLAMAIGLLLFSIVASMVSGITSNNGKEQAWQEAKNKGLATYHEDKGWLWKTP